MVVLKSQPATLGKIIDVSAGGLSFRYIYERQRLNHTTRLDISQVESGFFLSRAAFKTVSTGKISDFVQRFGVQFNGLNRRQRTRLAKFIEDSAIEAV